MANNMTYTHPEAMVPLSNASLTDRLHVLTSQGGPANINITTVCNSADFLTRHVIGPAVEASFRVFMKSCNPSSTSLLPDDWMICHPNDTFNCGNVHAVINSCRNKVAPECETRISSTDHPCTMGEMMGQGSAILFLVGMILVGVIIGITSTIAVCLICPSIHRWAIRKVHGDSPDHKQHRQSTLSAHYTDIDDRPTLDSNVQLKLSNSPIFFRSESNEDMLATENTVSGHPVYNDPAGNTTGPVANGISADNESADSAYEYMNRNNTVKSHNYMSLESPGTGNSSMEPQTDTPNYFILEKS